MGLKEIKGDWREDDCAVLEPGREKSHFINWKTRWTTTTVDNGGSQGEIEGRNLEEKEKEKNQAENKQEKQQKI